ncbi:MAG: SPFH domain-containing protein [Planctomycetes bacterium]|nr:SPFH domain-containing protein [Planctomycetota bacterium]
MGFWDRLKSQFIEILEWVDPTRETLVYKFPVYANEIKSGAKLTVRESQAAVFVNEGRVADVFQPGMHELRTSNMPILSTLLGWKYGFESPFKADVYFVNTRLFTGQKWGTQNPIIVRDPEIGPVRLRAFGTFTFRVADPGKLIKNIAGTDPLFTADEITGQLRNFMVARFADFTASAKVPLFDLASQYDELGEGGRKKIGADLADYGIEVPTFLVENISVPPEVEAAIDKRGQIQVTGDLNRFVQYQTGQAIADAAKNPGAAGDAMGLGAGFVMAQQMAHAVAAGAGQGAAAAPVGAVGPGVACACGARNPAGARFCSACGRPVAGARFCSKCGVEAAPGAKFCAGCGTALPA